MKKFILALVLSMAMVIPTLVCAQTWHTTNQATVAWDAVPVASGTVEYVLYLSNAITDPAKTNPAEIATVTDTTYIFTLNTEGRYFIGAKSRRLVDGVNVGESEVVWTDNPAVCADGVDFGIQYFEPPAAPGGFTTQ